MIKFGKLAISIILLLAGTYFVPVGQVLNAIMRFDLNSIVIALIFICAIIPLSTYRMKIMLHGLNVEAEYRSLHHVNVFSQIVGYFFFSTIGQMIYRTSVGELYLKNSHRLAFVTLLEKFFALSVLLLLSTFSALYISNSLEILNGNLNYIWIVLANISLAALLAYFFSMQRSQKRYLFFIFKIVVHKNYLLVILITLCMHLLMASAYVSLASALIPETSTALLFSVFLIVMLGAAVPVSFAGWGIRELSAGFAFSIIGINIDIGISTAILIGVLSLLSLLINGAISLLLGKLKPVQKEKKNFHAMDWKLERLLAFCASIIIPIAMTVQLRLPTETGNLAVNLADPFVIVTAIMFLSIWAIQLHRPKLWNIKYFNLGLACFVTMIGYGVSVAYFNFGGNHWGIFNRGIGVLVVLSYLFCGAFLASSLSKSTVIRVAKTIIISCLAAFILQKIFIPVLSFEDMRMLNWSPVHFKGMLGNRNALSVLVLLPMAVHIAYAGKASKIGNWLPIGIALFLLLQSGSRTGLICCACVLIAALIFKSISWQNLLKAILATIGFTALLQLLFFIGSSGQINQTMIVGDQIHQNTLINHQDRIQNYLSGFSMWMDYFIFGAGIGAFIEREVTTTIHNSTLWIAAETGVIGLLLFAILPFSITRHIWKAQRPLNPQILSILFCTIIIILFSQAHEILYQRVIWLLIGMIAVNDIFKFNINSKKIVEKPNL